MMTCRYFYETKVVVTRTLVVLPVVAEAVVADAEAVFV